MNRGTKDPSKAEIQIVDTLVVLCVHQRPNRGSRDVIQSLYRRLLGHDRC